jgi:hypothetical protein
MSQGRFLVLLAAALLAIGGAFYLSTQRYLPRDPRGARLFPGLAVKLDSVSAVSVGPHSGAPLVTLHKSGSRWTVAQREDYPADMSKLRKLLLALGDAALIEEKTSNPANYAQIGVGPGGTEVRISAPDGERAVIIGKPFGSGDFARRPSEAKSYLIEPAVTIETDPRRWIDPHLPDVAAGEIQRLEVAPAAGPAYALHRIGADGFALEAVPAHRTPLDAKALAPAADTYQGLVAEDVVAAASLPAAGADVKTSTATLTLGGNSRLVLIGTASGEKRWLQLQNAQDAPLTARTRGRAFEIPAYRYDAIFRPLEQLLVPPPSRQSAGSTGSKPSLKPDP